METHGLYVGGKWITTPDTITVVNPSTGQGFAEVSTVGRADAKQALDCAQEAFADWRRLTAEARGAYLDAIADELKRRADDVARTITLENGKPLAQSAGEVAMAVDHFRWFAQEGRRMAERLCGRRGLARRIQHLAA